MKAGWVRPHNNSGKVAYLSEEGIVKIYIKPADDAAVSAVTDNDEQIVWELFFPFGTTYMHVYGKTAAMRVAEKALR